MDLEEIRQKINQVDERMKALLLERMGYSAQVAEAKKQTGGSVYVPEREEEILRLRLQGVPAEYALECRAFFKQMIGISRTYQYAKLAEGQERLLALPDGEGEAVMQFACSAEDTQLSAVLNAAALAGLMVREMHVSGYCADALGSGFKPVGDWSGKQLTGGGRYRKDGAGGHLEEARASDGNLYCTLRLQGDFSKTQARAIVLQILEETKDAVLLPDGV